jgi:hypothetical protein
LEKACGKPGRASARPRPSAFAPCERPPFRPAGPKRLNELLPAAAKPCFEKYGFPAAEMLACWERYAGTELAAFTAPEKLLWPRGEGGRGAALVLRVAGARALEVQHKVPQLLERLNAAFGYRAVESVRLIQAPLPQAKPRKPKSGAPKHRLDATPQDAATKLAAALARLSEGVETRAAGL